MVAFAFRILYRIISVLVAAAIVYLVVSGVQVETASRGTILPSHVKRAAAIVVTGTPRSSQLSSDYRSKLRLAWSLYSGRRARLLYVALPKGASRSGSLSSKWTKGLSSAAKPSDLTSVVASNVGTELSRVVKRIGRGSRVIIVTDAINALYMQDVAAAAGLHPQVVSPKASKKLLFSQISALFREASGVAVGRVIGFTNASWAST